MTAVPATMDGGGVLYDRADPAEVAMLLDLVASDVDLQEQVLRSQDAALARMQARDFAGELLWFVQTARSSPRLPAPAVTPDFWEQFDTTARVAELQLIRPALYRALPTATRASGMTV